MEKYLLDLYAVSLDSAPVPSTRTLTADQWTQVLDKVSPQSKYIKECLKAGSIPDAGIGDSALNQEVVDLIESFDPPLYVEKAQDVSANP